MNDPITQAAIQWWRVELDADPTLPKNLTLGDILARAVPRVRAIFAGEVRWSETGPGDKAVWQGRPREVEWFARYDQRSSCPRFSSTHWHNVFDTVEMGPFGSCGPRMRYPYVRSIRAFGNANVGNMALSNLQVPGQMAGDQRFDVRQGYAVVNRPLTTADDIFITAIVGCRPVHSALHLREWILGVPMGITIPERQNFSATVEAYRDVEEPLEIVIHFEGIITREVG